jgi:8-oxo-dGTP diphosphatase
VTSLPYKIGTLLYAFNSADEVLLLQRAKAPNLGLWSPPGGKLEQAAGESPHHCARREAFEEMEIDLPMEDFRLVGLISERGYENQAHWLMFLFEIRPRLDRLPPLHREGAFGFFPRAAIESLPIPRTDREKIWPWFWSHRNGFFVAHCDSASSGTDRWHLLQSTASTDSP